MAKKKFVIEENTVVDEVKQPEEIVLVKAEEPKRQPEEIVLVKAEEPKRQPEEIVLAKKQTKKDTHKVYSFWANKEQIEVWKCYQEANSDLEKAEDLGLKAIQEYIENHALSGTDAEMYELKLKSKGLDNSSYR